MILITMIAKSRYRVEYRLNGGFAVASEGELEASVQAVKRHMTHMLAIAQGKTVPVPTQQEGAST